MLGPDLDPFFWLTRYASMTRMPSSRLPFISCHENLPHGSLPVRPILPHCGPTVAIIVPPGWYPSSGLVDALDAQTTREFPRWLYSCCVTLSRED